MLKGWYKLFGAITISLVLGAGVLNDLFENYEKKPSALSIEQLENHASGTALTQFFYGEHHSFDEKHVFFTGYPTVLQDEYFRDLVIFGHKSVSKGFTPGDLYIWDCVFLI